MQNEEQKVNRSISHSLAITKSGALALTNVAEVLEIARLMSKSETAVPKHLRDNPGACLGVALQASEWEMSPYAVANKSYVVNDRLAYEAQMINAVILRRAPIKGRFKISYSGEGNSRKCKVSAVLTDGDVVEYESPTLATIPVKNSPLWKGDPDQQLFYYSSRAMCRRHFPDVILGVYSPDELEDERDVSPRKTGTPDFLPPSVEVDAPAMPSAQEPSQDRLNDTAPPADQPRDVEQTAAAQAGAVSPPKAPELTGHTDLEFRMTADDVTYTDLMAYCAANKLSVPSKCDSVASLPIKLVQTILANWNDVLSVKGALV